MNLEEKLLEIIKELKELNSQIVDYKKNLLGGNIPMQLCPKCNGDGNLLRYNSPAFMGTSEAPICDVCDGHKIIPFAYKTTQYGLTSLGDGEFIGNK